MQQVEFRHFVAPLDNRISEQITALLGHKGSPWNEDIRCRIAGRRAGAQDHFCVASIGDQMVAQVWYTVSQTDPEIGLLGHVFTQPESRRQGIAVQLLRSALAEFHSHGGELMQLFTSTPYIVGIYEELGFEIVGQCQQAFHEADWYLRNPTESAHAVSTRFAASACRIRKLSEGDLPRFCLLYNREHETVMKDWALNIGSGVEAEFAFIGALEQMATGYGVSFVLETDRAIVGIMSLARSHFVPQAHLARFDAYIVPSFASSAGDLFDACFAEWADLGAEIVYAMAADAAKAQLFRQLGFQSKAALPGHLRVDQRRLDCELFEWTSLK